MKVNVISTSYPRFSGDLAGNFIKTLCEQMAEDGVSISVLAPDHLCAADDASSKVAIRRFTYMLPRGFQTLCYGDGVLPNIKRSWSKVFLLPFFMASFCLNAMSSSVGADIIHAHWILAGLVGVAVKKLTGKKLAVTVHGSDIRAASKNRFMRFLANVVSSGADLIICVSSDLMVRAASVGFPTSKMRVIADPVDVGLFSPKTGGVSLGRLIFVGRLVDGKGVLKAVDLFSQVRKSVPGASLEVVGDGPLMNSLREKINLIGLRDCVSLCGAVPHNELAQHLRQSDALMITSEFEGFGMTAVEAYSTKTPVVAFRVGGLTDIISDGVDGFLVDDDKEFVEKTVRFLEDCELREKMGANGRAKVEREYLPEKISDKTIKAYSDVLMEKD